MNRQGSRAPTDATQASSPSLLERVAGGDASAVSLLLDQHGPLVWSIVRKQVAHDIAEDVVQEIFIEIWKSADRFDPARGSEAVFVATLARRRVIDRRRKVGREPEAVELDIETPTVDAGLVDVDTADEARIAAEALAELKPVQQQVLRLAIVDGLTYARIAALTRLPLGTVKSHARRGLDRVRTLLEERRFSEGGQR